MRAVPAHRALSVEVEYWSKQAHSPTLYAALLHFHSDLLCNARSYGHVRTHENEVSAAHTHKQHVSHRNCAAPQALLRLQLAAGGGTAAQYGP